LSVCLQIAGLQRTIAATGLVLMLAACADDDILVRQIVGNPATRPVHADPDEAAALLTGLRADQDLSPVWADAGLNAIAQDYAELMATGGVVSHDLAGSLGARLDAGGYRYLVAHENLGGGYRSLSEAFDYWSESPSHRANLFADRITEIGIATAFNIDSPYRTFWVLLLAAPRASP
jgi:uncharacterized protein YkwD